MVAIKVRSAEDIAKAYLQAMGYSLKEAVVAAGLIMQKFGPLIEKNNDVAAVLDGFLSVKVKGVFGELVLDDGQSVAALKLAVLMGNIKSSWKENLFGDKWDDKFVAELQRVVPKNAPAYVMSEMKAQSIETLSPKSWFGKGSK